MHVSAYAADPEQQIRVPQPDVFVYDVAAASWSTAPPLPSARMECNAAALAGRVYVVGGSDAAGGIIAGMLSYAPGEAGWREESAPPLGMRQFCSCVVDGVLFCAGHFSDEVGLIAFDPAAAAAAGAQWTVGPPHPETPAHPSAPLVGAHNGEVWVVGGSRKRSVHVYSPSTKAWRPEADYPTDQSWGALWSSAAGEKRQPRLSASTALVWRLFGGGDGGGGGGGGNGGGNGGGGGHCCSRFGWACSATDGRLLAVGGAHFDADADSYVFDDRIFAFRG